MIFILTIISSTFSKKVRQKRNLFQKKYGKNVTFFKKSTLYI